MRLENLEHFLLSGNVSEEELAELQDEIEEYISLQALKREKKNKREEQ